MSVQDVYNAKERAYEMVSKLADYGLGKLPSDEYVDLMRDIGGGGDAMKEMFIGSAPPDHAMVAEVPAPNFDARTAQIVQAVSSSGTPTAAVLL